MSQHRLSSSQVRILMDLYGLGFSNIKIAQRLGITEGTVRYRLKRQSSGKVDGRLYGVCNEPYPKVVIYAID